MLALTSQNPDEVEKAAAKWKLSNTTFQADPDNAFVQYLETTYPTIEFIMGDRSGYPNGMVQPAELVFYKGRLIVGWVRKPSLMNFDGAVGRPDATKMWKYIEKTVKANPSGTDKDAECNDGRKFFSMKSSVI